ncbi:diacylglycerol/lipid kinase family protein [Butyrivibrio sp. AE2032]|uniref:diacylglycerol/lipid kinase family protein n=1 Tax=Butyrivibrio sp. AE2032 TaxID=1458463 RepID=UPI000550BDC7|nr:YegS/Rv2252/BmrU family lipid kinase [Butyrivibrio sp. AE2032]
MSKRKRALVLINQKAGTGKAGNDTFPIITALAQADYEPIVYPIIPGTVFSSDMLLDEYDGKIDLVLCSGGDGTLNHVVEAMMSMKKKPLLSYIPNGSTNDFARGLGIPSTRAKALEVAIHGKPYSYDLGKMNNNYFNYVAAFGAFSKVSYATDQDLKNVLGYAAYVISAIAELPQNIGCSTHMRVEADGIDEEGDFLFGSMSNSASVGGMNLFGDTDIKQDDGKMELMLIRAPKNLTEFNAILAALASKEAGNPYITFKQVSYAKFSCAENVEWTLDGEFGGAYRDTEIQVINKAITIMVKP